MPTPPSQLARHAATDRLIAAHADEWAGYLAEERAARGMRPVSLHRITRLARQRDAQTEQESTTDG